MGTFLNAVKNLINSLTAKTSSTASTADMVQLHDANGNPNGKISLADLASVLGGAVTGISSNSDLNNYTNTGLYIASTVTVGRTIINSPVGIAFILRVCNVGPFIFQFVIASVSRAIYMRRYQNSNASWTSWYQFEGTEMTN